MKKQNSNPCSYLPKVIGITGHIGCLGYPLNSESSYGLPVSKCLTLLAPLVLFWAINDLKITEIPDVVLQCIMMLKANSKTTRQARRNSRIMQRLMQNVRMQGTVALIAAIGDTRSLLFAEIMLIRRGGWGLVRRLLRGDQVSSASVSSCLQM